MIQYGSSGGLSISVCCSARPAASWSHQEKKLRDRSSILRIGVTLVMLMAGNSLGVSLALAQARPDPMLNILPAWDANHDGVYTCEEWKSFMDRLFASADKGRK